VPITAPTLKKLKNEETNRKEDKKQKLSTHYIIYCLDSPELGECVNTAANCQMGA